VNDPGIKLTTYFSERRRSGHRFLADALFDVYERHGMRTSVLLRGAAGFGPHHHLQSDRSLTLSETLPAVSIAVDARERIERMLPDVTGVVGHGLVSLERAQIATGERLDRPFVPKDHGAIKLTIYGGRKVRSEGQPGYVAAIDLLRDCGVTGASVLLAVDGTLHGDRHRARFLARNAGVPLMLLAVGDGANISRALPELRSLIDEPVATVERVQVCKSSGVLLAEPEAIPAQDASGLHIWQKLMVHCEEQSKHRGHPLHLELMRRLAEAGAAGATVLRGVRGFYEDRPPFADRLLSLRRNVPLHIVIVDTPHNMRRWWPIINELTNEDGIVTSELVPALHAVRLGGRARLQLAATPTADSSRPTV
jgi:PII-like signaling protein